MKKFLLPGFLMLLMAFANAQTPYGRVYTLFNTKCQSAACHSATSTNDGPKFDQSADSVYNEIFNMPSLLYPASVAQFEMLVNPEMPYQSFLLRKIAGASFDTDLALDTNGDEGILMTDTGGNPLANADIEWVRQWIRYGALETYGSKDPLPPDYSTVLSYYTDTPSTAFLPKPPKPAAGTGVQLRCGPVFMPVTGAIEQEIVQQQVVHFPFLPEVYEIDGYLNEQSHHFLLFAYIDSTNARTPATSIISANGSVDVEDIAQVTPATSNFAEPFAGGKNLTGAWQANQKFPTPAGTAFLWNQTTYLDMDYHTKNYNATSVLPCDFYFNVYYRPRNPNTIPMISTLINNANLGQYQSECTSGLFPYSSSLPYNVPFTQLYTDPENDSVNETRYIWMMAGHTHSLGTAYYIIRQDTTGQLADTVYNGQYDYTNNIDLGYWQWQHPPLEYLPNQLPVVFGKNGSGLVASTSWFDTVSTRCIYFGFTTQNEMQLFYYMYTNRLPDAASAVNDIADNPFSFTVQPNPVTEGNGKLVYVLAQPAKVQASIADITGKIVATLSEENEQEGAHVVSLNNTKRLASGIYFARLSVNGAYYIKKFVVTE